MVAEMLSLVILGLVVFVRAKVVCHLISELGIDALFCQIMPETESEHIAKYSKTFETKGGAELTRD